MMRSAFVKELVEVANSDDRVWLLTADLGYKLFDDFPQDRFINVGVAEQNMVGVAAGLALSGKVVFCYSIATFLLLRAFEFIRNDVAIQRLPVILVGTVDYPGAGVSHNFDDDLDIVIMNKLGVECWKSLGLKTLIAMGGTNYIQLRRLNGK